ncbi:glycosyltransferase [Terriglobus saanensis]|uniref:glycosyltransferase n=1 Tax=Terriglobus saanensis TaxID=870903 RepID=UPI001650E1AD|nr:glycosyltransferase [Terriglobus saanensis]
MRERIFAVVVLYKTVPADSLTLQTLFRATNDPAKTSLRFSILIHDNTPGGQDPGTLPEGIRYVAATNNPGLAAAYNGAAATAKEEGYEWLLTLDQDTDLPVNTFDLLLQHMGRYPATSGGGQVGAIVPHVIDHGRPISPFRFRGGFLPCLLPGNFSGIAQPYTSAINSAALVRISALEKIGGYDERFPLNNSDSSLFHRLGEAGIRIAVAGDLRVQHELAIMNRQERMTTDRYRQLLADERAFWDLHMHFLGRVERMLRLLGRVCKDLLERRNADFRSLSLKEIRFRLLSRKRNRVKRWKQNFQ